MRTLFVLLWLSLSLSASTERKIIVASFPTEMEAQKALTNFQLKLSSQFLALKKRYQFTIVARSSGRSYIIALEPFNSYKEAKDVKSTLPTDYNDAFINRYTAPESSTIIKIIETDNNFKAPIVKRESIETAPLKIPFEKREKIDNSVDKKLSKKIASIIQKMETDKTPLNREVTPTAHTLTEKSSMPSYLLPAILSAIIVLLLALLFRLYRNQQRLKQESRSSKSTYYTCLNTKNTLNETLKSKDSFLENLTHHLKKLIETLSDSTDSLHDATRPHDHQKIVDRIKVSTSKLDEIINNIIDITKLQSNRLSLEQIEFDLNHVLETTAISIYQSAQEKGIEITFDINIDLPVKFIGDPVRITQILINMLTYSIHHIDKGEIVISINKRLTSHDDFNLEFALRDRGNSYNEEEIKSIFDTPKTENHFDYTFDSDTNMGLLMAKQLIDKMGGSVTLNISHRQETNFIFDILVNLPETVESRKYRLNYKEIMDYTILVIDNNMLAARVLRQQLEYFHINVQSVFTWIDALKVINSDFQSIDFIILNSTILGELSIEELSIISKKNALPIVFIVHDTRDINYQIIEKIKHAYFLNKPYTQKALVELLTKIYEKRLEGSF